jgi:hypothetical protein
VCIRVIPPMPNNFTFGKSYKCCHGVCVTTMQVREGFSGFDECFLV